MVMLAVNDRTAVGSSHSNTRLFLHGPVALSSVRGNRAGECFQGVASGNAPSPNILPPMTMRHEISRKDIYFCESQRILINVKVHAINQVHLRLK